MLGVRFDELSPNEFGCTTEGFYISHLSATPNQIKQRHLDNRQFHRNTHIFGKTLYKSSQQLKR